MDAESTQFFISAITDGLYSIVVLWLLVREQNAHTDTREAYRQDLRDFAIKNDSAPTALSPPPPP